MDVSVYSPGADAAAAAAVGADLAASPAALFASCTHVALQCALTDETRGLVDLELIRSMPGTGPRVLVNVARVDGVRRNDARRSAIGEHKSQLRE